MFTDYLDLRTAVIDAVGSPEKLTPVFDRLTKMAEIKLNRRLRTRHQIKSLPISISGGTGWLPSEMLEPIGLFDTNGNELIAGTASDRMAGRANYTLQSFQIIGYDGDYTLQFYATLDSLANGMSATNWLLEYAPDVYLWAVCEQAAKWLKDIEGAQVYASLADQAIQELTGFDDTQRRANMRVRVKGPTP